MFMEKILRKLQQEREMDAREFKKSLMFMRLDNKDIDDIIADLRIKGIIKIERKENGSKIVMKGR